MSGGVDSLVAACLLKNRGWTVFGIHFITGYETFRDTDTPSCLEDLPSRGKRAGNCTDISDALADHPIRRLGERIGIPILFLDCRHVFQRVVVDYFCRSYAQGVTPNPCLVCNPCVKFGKLLDFAQQKGASALATGHYARVQKTRDEPVHLFKGADPAKDQSYFLSFLTQAQLSKAVFPLGDMTKAAVRALARRCNLTPISANESQDICFIKGKSYSDFLVENDRFIPTDGPIVNTSGKRIGTHHGLHLFTIGQRKGINCPAAEPYYVVHIDTENNQLTVGAKKDLLSTRCHVEDVNWIQEPMTTDFNAHVKLRYRHRAVPALIHVHDTSQVTLQFDSPQAAVTPGQGAVFYLGDEVLGGGWIQKGRIRK